MTSHDPHKSGPVMYILDPLTLQLSLDAALPLVAADRHYTPSTMGISKVGFWWELPPYTSAFNMSHT
jgi:hypothetical protein